MLKVLLVEQDDGVRDSLGQVLRAWGHDCVAVASGREGLVRLLRWSEGFDVLLVDQTLPGLATHELLRGAANALYGPVHLILMVAKRLGPEARPWATDRCGPVTLLPKPFSMPMLRSALDGTPIHGGDASPSAPGSGFVGRGLGGLARRNGVDGEPRASTA